MRIEDYDYHLPPDRIAQHPAPRRDDSRLMVIRRQPWEIRHQRFAALPDWLAPGDLLVLNDSRVLPARLRGRKLPQGARLDVLLAEENETNDWWVLLRPAKRVRPGVRLRFERGEAAIEAQVMDKNAEGQVRLRFLCEGNILHRLGELGEMPLPPYIHRSAGPLPEDQERYQTVYAQQPGSLAAPTAGLHFTQQLLRQLEARGVALTRVTLHVGLGTFAPVKVDRIEEHPMHAEWARLPEDTAKAIEATRQRGGRIVAVGTTSLRVLESAAQTLGGKTLREWSGWTRLFVYPPFEFRVVDALLTNFHLPRSTLLMLVSAFASPGRTEGRDRILAAYAEAVREGYRFYSYGDAMLLL